MALRTLVTRLGLVASSSSASVPASVPSVRAFATGAGELTSIRTFYVALVLLAWCGWCSWLLLWWGVVLLVWFGALGALRALGFVSFRFHVVVLSCCVRVSVVCLLVYCFACLACL